jgi:hypothetical protein
MLYIIVLLLLHYCYFFIPCYRITKLISTLVASPAMYTSHFMPVFVFRGITRLIPGTGTTNTAENIPAAIHLVMLSMYLQITPGLFR